jgi:60 kDa SS-A/Ro ribonucleoprotein
LFVGSVGNDPSLADIVKMVHPKPHSLSRRALYAWLVGREFDESELPEIVRQYERLKRQTVRVRDSVPDVPFQMLTSLPLTEQHWRQIARNASWQMTRMNLNTFQRHGVFDDKELIGVIANRLKNPRLIERARVFPYQLMAAYMNASRELPSAVTESLQDAMEIAISNVPHIAGKVYVCPDVSGSMHSPVTGERSGATTKVRCIDVAALVAAAVLRRNPQAEVIPFESNVVTCRLNPRDTVLTNAQKLAALPCGGTNCSAPLAWLNQRKAKGDVVIYVSDNESWIDTPAHGRFGGVVTRTMKEWSTFKERNPQAKMICIDIQPYATTQAAERADIINVGGFSDQVFSLIADVAGGNYGEDHWVAQIERTRI